MNIQTIASVAAAIVCLGSVVPAPVAAQPAQGRTQQQDVGWHHRMMSQMMKDMTEEMSRMSDQMAKGVQTPEQRKDMAQRMGRVSTMMQRMSGLAARPAMANPESQKQMETIRKQMDEMMRDPKMTPPKK